MTLTVLVLVITAAVRALCIAVVCGKPRGLVLCFLRHDWIKESSYVVDSHRISALICRRCSAFDTDITYESQ